MHVDHVVIGAGPSGLACALRLALAGFTVALIEKHTKVGGLNSFYARPLEKNGEKIRCELDVGLHAITNFSVPEKKTSRMNKLFRSLRIHRTELELEQQHFSWITLGQKKLVFTNNIQDLTNSVQEQYPAELIGWDNFLSFLGSYDEFKADQPHYISSKIELKNFFKNEQFINHILFPVLTYGSPWEEDMDFNLFVCIFRSMFLEGLCRPRGGIRPLWNAVVKNCEHFKVQMLMGESVQKIQRMENGLLHIKTSKQDIVCQKIFSSMGLIETQQILGETNGFESQKSTLGFIELMVIFDRDLSSQEDLPTLHFSSENLELYYHSTSEIVNTDMAIYCIPSRYQGVHKNCDGMIRMTCLTNPQLWFDYTTEDYKLNKQKVLDMMLKKMLMDFPMMKDAKILLTDIFTPKTIYKYTGHHQGSLYGATLKVKDGQSTWNNVFYIGADQGYPGITGSMLSGIVMANMYGIMPINSSSISLN